MNVYMNMRQKIMENNSLIIIRMLNDENDVDVKMMYMNLRGEVVAYFYVKRATSIILFVCVTSVPPYQFYFMHCHGLCK